MSQAISSLAELPPLEGFDFKQGLARVVGNFALYFRLLKELKKTLEASHIELQEQLAAHDLPALNSTIHKIKGVSGNLGGETLHKLSMELELALKTTDPQDPTLIANLIIPYIEAVKKDFIALSILDNFVFTKANPQPEVLPNKVQELRPHMQETLTLLRESNTAAQETFEVLATMLGSNPKIDKIRQHLDSFDFMGAESCLLELAQSLAINIED